MKNLVSITNKFTGEKRKFIGMNTAVARIYNLAQHGNAGMGWSLDCGPMLCSDDLSFCLQFLKNQGYKLNEKGLITKPID